MTRHRRRSNENSHAILALWLSEKAQPQAPRPESSPANWLEQRRSWGIAVTLRLRIGAKWLQLQCVMVLRGRKGGSLRPQGLSPCVALTSAMGQTASCEPGLQATARQERIESRRWLLVRANRSGILVTPHQPGG